MYMLVLALIVSEIQQFKMFDLKHDRSRDHRQIEADCVDYVDLFSTNHKPVFSERYDNE